MAERQAKPEPTQAQPQRAGLTPPRNPRSQGRVGSPPRPKRKLGLPYGEGLQGEARRWFDREVRGLERLAHTERLAGDYVAAQRLERELDAFITQAFALIGREED